MRTDIKGGLAPWGLGPPPVVASVGGGGGGGAATVDTYYSEPPNDTERTPKQLRCGTQPDSGWETQRKLMVVKSLTQLAQDQHSRICQSMKRNPELFESLEVPASKTRIYSEGASCFRLVPKNKIGSGDPKIHTRINGEIDEWIATSKMASKFPTMGLVDMSEVESKGGKAKA